MATPQRLALAASSLYLRVHIGPSKPFGEPLILPLRLKWLLIGDCRLQGAREHDSRQPELPACRAVVALRYELASPPCYCIALFEVCVREPGFSDDVLGRRQHGRKSLSLQHGAARAFEWNFKIRSPILQYKGHLAVESFFVALQSWEIIWTVSVL